MSGDGPNAEVAQFRVFCAYGPQYRAPGCGAETFVETEAEAEELAEAHGDGTTHVADYERWSQ